MLFYPRTLWRVLRHPLALAAQAEAEMSEREEDQFIDLVSPPLFLMLSILLAHALEVGLHANLAPFTSSAAKEVLTSDTNLLIFRAITFSLFPLLMATGLLHRLRRDIDRATLRRPFFLQCFFASPFVVTLSVASVFARLGFSLVATGLTVGAVLWYLGVETESALHPPGDRAPACLRDRAWLMTIAFRGFRFAFLLLDRRRHERCRRAPLNSDFTPGRGLKGWVQRFRALVLPCDAQQQHRFVRPPGAATWTSSPRPSGSSPISCWSFPASSPATRATNWPNSQGLAVDREPFHPAHRLRQLRGGPAPGPEEKESGSPLFQSATEASRRGHLVATHFQRSQANLASTFERLNDRQMAEIVKAIIAAGQVLIFGSRSSHAFAQYLRWQIIQVVPRVTAIPGAGETLAEHLAGIGERDCVIVFGTRRQTRQMELLPRRCEPGQGQGPLHQRPGLAGLRWRHLVAAVRLPRPGAAGQPCRGDGGVRPDRDHGDRSLGPRRPQAAGRHRTGPRGDRRALKPPAGALRWCAGPTLQAGFHMADEIGTVIACALLRMKF